MPSDDLLYRLQDPLVVEKHWQVNGEHYGKTAQAWLENLDRHRKAIMPVFQDVYGQEDAGRWLQRWRIFFMACAELWGYRNGREWMVSHYLLRKGTQTFFLESGHFSDELCRPGNQSVAMAGSL
jgi:cyclopropane-fatty-acyl-phospholipid synthase